MSDALTMSERIDEAQAGGKWNPLPAANIPLERLLGAFGDDAASARRSLQSDRRQTIDAILRGSESGAETPTDALGKSQLLTFLLGTVLAPEVAASRAEELMQRYGTLGGLLAAPVERLAAHLGSAEAAVLLKVLQLLMRQAAREPIEERPLIDSSAALHTYLSTSMRHEPIEMVRLLFLDSSNRLQGEEVHSRGTINHCPLYPREVVRRVIEMNANAVIIVHNHPSGDAAPSESDVSMTNVLSQTLERIGVSLHDHVIIGANKNFSFREHGCLEH